MICRIIEEMKDIIPGTSDGASEKHVPIISKKDGKVIVEVGSVKHPMLDEHYIEWIVLETTDGIYRKNLNPGDEPRAEFVLNNGEQVVEIRLSITIFLNIRYIITLYCKFFTQK